MIREFTQYVITCGAFINYIFFSEIDETNLLEKAKKIKNTSYVYVTPFLHLAVQ